MKLLAFLVCALLWSLSLSSPLTFHVGFGPGADSGVSSGPGLGGTPMLVDTSAHSAILNSYQMGRSNLDSGDIRITLRKPTVVESEVPIIRPATNLPKNEYNEDGIIYAMLRSLRRYFSTPQVSSAPSVVNVSLEPTNDASRNLDLPSDASAFRLALATRTRNLVSTPDVSASLPVIRPATNVQSRGLPIIRPATNVHGRGLSIIRPATNVDNSLKVGQLPIIRPATNIE